MHQLVIKYKNAKAFKALQEVAKTFDMIIEKSVTPVDPTPNIPIRFSEKPDVNSLSGIWKDNPVTLEDLRKKAWGDRL